jgi:hypothetical protein
MVRMTVAVAAAGESEKFVLVSGLVYLRCKEESDERSDEKNDESDK